MNTVVPAATTPNPQPPATPRILQSQLPVSFQPFMVANALTDAHLQKVYHPVGPGAQLIISDGPGNSGARKQISLALFLL